MTGLLEFSQRRYREGETEIKIEVEIRYGKGYIFLLFTKPEKRPTHWLRSIQGALAIDGGVRSAFPVLHTRGYHVAATNKC